MMIVNVNDDFFHIHTEVAEVVTKIALHIAYSTVVTV